MAETLGIDSAEIGVACAALESEGSIIQGRFTAK
jgi:hypothetical protein